ncbi:MAG: ribosomal protein S18-alanine N-acetyltransferase [Nitrospiria bacterium]
MNPPRAGDEGGKKSIMSEKSIAVDLIFEPMGLTDLDRVMAIERSSFPFPWSKGMFLSELHDNPLSLSYIAKEGTGREIIGYVLFSLIFEELHLLNLAVHPAWRRKGIGEALVHHILSIGQERQIQKVNLEVRVSNQVAQALYRKIGFKEIGVRRNYYHRPAENALLFQYDLESHPMKIPLTCLKEEEI